MPDTPTSQTFPTTPTSPPRYRLLLLLGYLFLLMVSFIDPPYPDQLLLQHIPTVIALLGLAMLHRFVDIGRGAFICIVLFLFPHLVGARYIYSYVPYDSWSESLFGVGISELLGWKRNNYDRLVHFGYGLLLVRPAVEILRDRLRLSPRMSSYVAVEFIMASSMVYELAEWAIALLLSPGAAEGYNGQQGDPWDAQKDMALASLGAIIGMMMIGRRGRVRRSEDTGGRG